MTQEINEPVGVLMYSSIRLGTSYPHLVIWQEKQYLVKTCHDHYSVMEGVNRHHIYDVTAGEFRMRLNLDSGDLTWRLVEVSGKD